MFSREGSAGTPEQHFEEPSLFGYIKFEALFFVFSSFFRAADGSGGSEVNRRKLDAFQAKCLRVFLCIPRSFYSCVPNTDVLSRAITKKLSVVPLYGQLMPLHRIATLPLDDVMRTCVFGGQRYT